MEQAVRVLKFGGTSVGSGERIRSMVAPIICDTAAEVGQAFPVIVVSAMSGITDQLLRIARYASTGEYGACEQELATLTQKHFDAIHEVTTNEAEHVALRQSIGAALSRLQADILTLQKTAEAGQNLARATAAIAAWGERLSIHLVAAAVRDLGQASEAVVEEVIIAADPEIDPQHPIGVVVGADPIPEQTRTQARLFVRPLVERKIVPIVPGFIVRTVSGWVTTVGRNGSDYSATVIGAALDCVEVSIYTDVDGVLTADPRQVTNARLLQKLTYLEAAQLSWFGAKVLHPRTLIPVASRGIPVSVRNTFRPHVRGTIIEDGEKGHSGARAITIKKNLALVTLENSDMFGASERAGEVFEIAARAGAAPIAICSSSGQHLSFAVEESAAVSVTSLLQHDLTTWRVRSRQGLAVCACIGSSFIVDPTSPARAVMALAQERIPIITQGASEQGIILVLEERYAEQALRCLHRDLIAPVIPLVRHGSSEPTLES